jgi:hypothetical protein
MEANDRQKSLLAQRYERVNAAWPPGPLPALTAAEAASAARRLYRFGYSLFDRKRAYRGPVRITSGRNYSYVRSGVLRVNPEKGWHDLVHDLSHYVHSRCTNEAAHRGGHAFVERVMIEHVVKSGWLTGTLKRPEKPKLVRNVKADNYANAISRLKRWETKAKRAQTAIRKLRISVRRYERQGVSA